MTQEQTHPGGRPSKLPKFLEKAKEIIEESGHDLAVLTDEEFFEEVNDNLEEKDQICKRSFEYWVAGSQEGESGEEFLRLISKIRRKMKRNLYKIGFENEDEKKPSNMSRFILERKFEDMRQRTHSENKNENTQEMVGFDINKSPMMDPTQPGRAEQEAKVKEWRDKKKKAEQEGNIKKS